MKQLGLTLDPPPAPPPHRFDGDSYVAQVDQPRLAGQFERILRLMLSSGAWRTLAEIAAATGAPPASVSAQLRHMRKPRFGSYVVMKRRRGDVSRGLFEYRVLPPELEP